MDVLHVEQLHRVRIVWLYGAHFIFGVSTTKDQPRHTDGRKHHVDLRSPKVREAWSYAFLYGRQGPWAAMVPGASKASVAASMCYRQTTDEQARKSWVLDYL